MTVVKKNQTDPHNRTGSVENTKVSGEAIRKMFLQTFINVKDQISKYK